MDRINKVSLALYIAYHVKGQLALVKLQCDQPEVREVNCAVKFVSVIGASKLVTIEVESQSQTRAHLYDLCD